MLAPLRAGAQRRERHLRAIRDALMRPLAHVLDTSQGSDFEIESYAEAYPVLAIWVVNARVANSMRPAQMLETLATWESAMGIRVPPGASVVARRAAVAAKFRGLNGNQLGALEEAAIEAMGAANFSAILLVDDDVDGVTFWPGINPGPPGYEWSSTRCIVAFRVTAAGLSADTYRNRHAALTNALDAMMASWATFAIGQGSGFVVNVGTVAVTFI